MDRVMPLRMSGVWFGYPGAADAVIRGATLAVAPGQTVGIFGENGAGKTTLTRLAMALLHPDRGEVVTAGIPTAGRHPEDLAGSVGYVFQQPETQLFARTVREELAFGPLQLGWDAGRTAARVAEVLEEVGLVRYADQHPYDLPLALRRMVAFGAALVPDPLLLILDEPTAALDRDSRRVVQGLVRARAQRGLAVLAVTHDLEFAIEALERAVLLQGGGILHDAPMAEVLQGGLLPRPPVVDLVRRLGLAPASFRQQDVAEAVARHVAQLP